MQAQANSLWETSLPNVKIKLLLVAWSRKQLIELGKRLAKNAIVSVLSKVLNRHVNLLPAQAASTERILAVDAAYRVEGEKLPLKILERLSGEIEAEILTYVGHFPTQNHWLGARRPYSGPCTLELDLGTGGVLLDGMEWGRAPIPLPRRFCVRVTITTSSGLRRSRLIGHYIPIARSIVDKCYYSGDDYVDYELESAGEPELVLDLLRTHGAMGPILEVGCATGGMLKALLSQGFDAYGLDVSQWAVQEATKCIGAGRAWLCDVEKEPLPERVSEIAPFGVLLLWAVLEHFRDPFDVLQKLSALARTGSLLLINTTNFESLAHYAFGRDWEGFFDYTHYGVEQISVTRMRNELPKLGWRIDRLTTRLLWDGSADPTHATLREVATNDARFRKLLEERHLGDLLICAAVKQ